MVVRKVLRAHELPRAGRSDLVIGHPFPFLPGQIADLGCPGLKRCRVDEVVGGEGEDEVALGFEVRYLLVCELWAWHVD